MCTVSVHLTVWARSTFQDDKGVISIAQYGYNLLQVKAKGLRFFCLQRLTEMQLIKP